LAERGRSPRAPASPGSAGPHLTTFDQNFVDDLRHWVSNDRKTALRLLDIVEAVRRDPFAGIGKPEPLKYLGAGVWSRRLTQEHRVVYRVTAERIDFLQARYHY
jgi:toxin YoeB